MRSDDYYLQQALRQRRGKRRSLSHLAALSPALTAEVIVARSLGKDIRKPPMAQADINALRRVMGVRPEVPLNIHTGGSPHYLWFKDLAKPSPGAVHMGGVQNLGVLAHEFGHTSIPTSSIRSALARLRGPGVAGALAGELGVIFSDDETTGRNAALLGTGAAAPVVAEELIASGKGYRGMRDIGKSPLKSLAAAKGLPTYLTVASIPMLTYLLSKHYGGYKEAQVSMDKEAVSKEMVHRAMRNRALRTVLWDAIGKRRGLSGDDLKRFVQQRHRRWLPEDNATINKIRELIGRPVTPQLRAREAPLPSLWATIGRSKGDTPNRNLRGDALIDYVKRMKGRLADPRDQYMHIYQQLANRKSMPTTTPRGLLRFLGVPPKRRTELLHKGVKPIRFEKLKDDEWLYTTPSGGRVVFEDMTGGRVAGGLPGFLSVAEATVSAPKGLGLALTSTKDEQLARHLVSKLSPEELRGAFKQYLKREGYGTNLSPENMDRALTSFLKEESGKAFGGMEKIRSDLNRVATKLPEWGGVLTEPGHVEVAGLYGKMGFRPIATGEDFNLMFRPGGVLSKAKTREGEARFLQRFGVTPREMLTAGRRAGLTQGSADLLGHMYQSVPPRAVFRRRGRSPRYGQAAAEEHALSKSIRRAQQRFLSPKDLSPVGQYRQRISKADKMYESMADDFSLPLRDYRFQDVLSDTPGALSKFTAALERIRATPSYLVGDTPQQIRGALSQARGKAASLPGYVMSRAPAA